MGTDWFVKVKCPKPATYISSEEEHIKQCSGCPYVIWENPESVAGFMSTMCGVRVGNIWMAKELDDIGEKLTGIEKFTKLDSSPALKLHILKQIRTHSREGLWSTEGLSRERAFNHLNDLIEFCKRAEKKCLDIWAWA